MGSFECTNCDKTYKHRCNLVAHQRMHNGTAFACEVCEKRFEHKGHLEQHRIAHTFSKPFACDVDGCDKKFALRLNMIAHKRTVHKKVPGKYQCEQCGHACATPDKLSIHRRTHTGERPFACTECVAKFIQKSHLQSHYRAVHTLDRPFACAHCEKTFATNTYCRRHMRSAHK